MTIRRGICRANNPETCRYHRPGAGVQALTNFEHAQYRFQQAVTFEEKSAAAIEVAETQSLWDATDEGYSVLRKQSFNASTSGDFTNFAEITTRLTKAKIIRAEERQSGAATETTFFTPGNMKDKLKHIEILVNDAGSDRFLDIMDKYNNTLKDAIIDYDTYAFTKSYNRLVEELANEGGSVAWFDKDRGVNWLKKVNSTRISGRVYKSRSVSLENTTASMTFEA